MGHCHSLLSPTVQTETRFDSQDPVFPFSRPTMEDPISILEAPPIALPNVFLAPSIRSDPRTKASTSKRPRLPALLLHNHNNLTIVSSVLIVVNRPEAGPHPNPRSLLVTEGQPALQPTYILPPAHHQTHNLGLPAYKTISPLEKNKKRDKAKKKEKETHWLHNQ